jgi:hypothetical protein
MLTSSKPNYPGRASHVSRVLRVFTLRLITELCMLANYRWSALTDPRTRASLYPRPNEGVKSEVHSQRVS